MLNITIRRRLSIVQLDYLIPTRGILVSVDLQSNQNKDQEYAYLVQIQNDDGVTVLLSWIAGTLPADHSSSPSQSWTPIETWQYIVTVKTVTKSNSLVTIKCLKTIEVGIADPFISKAIHLNRSDNIQRCICKQAMVDANNKVFCNGPNFLHKDTIENASSTTCNFGAGSDFLRQPPHRIVC